MAHVSSAIVLPAGVLLYKPSTERRYRTLKRLRGGEHWIVGDGWSVGAPSIGPLIDAQLLRAVRVAESLVPQGCELGPWQDGFYLFDPTPLPGTVNEWEDFDLSWAPPSVTQYDASMMSLFANDACCGGTPRSPDIRWNGVDVGSAAEHSLPDAYRWTGALTREWNVHPAGSPVYSTARGTDDAFVVVDLL